MSDESRSLKIPWDRLSSAARDWLMAKAAESGVDPLRVVEEVLELETQAGEEEAPRREGD
jgi:hypothetical protein